jgi:hypothetical protein
MRTTINIPDDVGEVIRSVAASKGISFGEALADLVRKSLRPPARIRDDSPFPCFAVPADAPPITLARTLAAEDQP